MSLALHPRVRSWALPAAYPTSLFHASAVLRFHDSCVLLYDGSPRTDVGGRGWGGCSVRGDGEWGDTGVAVLPERVAVPIARNGCGVPRLGGRGDLLPACRRIGLRESVRYPVRARGLEKRCENGCRAGIRRVDSRRLQVFSGRNSLCVLPVCCTRCWPFSPRSSACSGSTSRSDRANAPAVSRSKARHRGDELP